MADHTPPSRLLIALRVYDAIREHGVTVDDICTIADVIGVPVESLLVDQ